MLDANVYYYKSSARRLSDFRNWSRNSMAAELTSRAKEIFDDFKVDRNVCFLQIFVVPRSQLRYLLSYAGKWIDSPELYIYI